MEVKRMKVKVCLIGEAAVGKTSLIRRFVLDNFDDKYIQTLGTKVSKKELVSSSPDGSGELKVDMTIWDIMGQKGFRELLKEAYFYGARGILAVCDVTRRKTLDDLDDWIEGVYSVTGKIPIEFLGNKIDLKDQRQISEDEMTQAARAYDSPFHFTSAKAGVNVETAFQSLAERVAKDRYARKVLPDE
ncbi:MAG: GTP-binding protein [Thermoplasmata archaeon]|nr:GTP-binding protein [Thermoplasmata archaeon]